MCHASGADILIHEAISCHHAILILRNINIDPTVAGMKEHIIKRFGYLPCGKGHIAAEYEERNGHIDIVHGLTDKIELCSGSIFQNPFFKVIILYFDYHFTEVCCKGSNWPQISIGLNGGRSVLMCEWIWIVTLQSPWWICRSDR